MAHDRSSIRRTEASLFESDESHKDPLRDNAHQDRDESELTVGELLGWTEFACWTALVLMPFLYWVNGSAVSTDQFVVRSVLVFLAAVGAIGLRSYAWLHRR
jgi:hypothetical protein